MLDVLGTSQVDAGRAFISRCYFDREKTKRGREALINYHYHWDDKRKCYQDNPYHDWSSNGSDAWQYLAVGHKFSAAKTVKVADVARPMQLSTSNTAYMGV